MEALGIGEEQARDSEWWGWAVHDAERANVDDDWMRFEGESYLSGAWIRRAWTVGIVGALKRRRVKSSTSSTVQYLPYPY